MKKSVLLLKTTSALAAAGAAACLAVPLLLQLSLGFTLHSINKGAVAVIGGADGPTAIFITGGLDLAALPWLGGLLAAGARRALAAGTLHREEAGIVPPCIKSDTIFRKGVIP